MPTYTQSNSDIIPSQTLGYTTDVLDRPLVLCDTVKDITLTNSSFENWQGVYPDAVPTGYSHGFASILFKNTDIAYIKSGTSSLHIHGPLESNAGRCYIEIGAIYGLDYLRNKTITFRCWVYSTSTYGDSTYNAGLSIQENSGTTFSHVTADNTFQWVTVTRTISNTATYIYLNFLTATQAVGEAYFDDAYLGVIKPVIFYTRADSLPVVFYGRPSGIFRWNIPEIEIYNPSTSNVNSTFFEIIPAQTLGYSAIVV